MDYTTANELIYAKLGPHAYVDVDDNGNWTAGMRGAPHSKNPAAGAERVVDCDALPLPTPVTGRSAEEVVAKLVSAHAEWEADRR